MLASSSFVFVTKAKSVDAGVVVVWLDFGQKEGGPLIPDESDRSLSLQSSHTHLIKAPAAAGDSLLALTSPCRSFAFDSTLSTTCGLRCR